MTKAQEATISSKLKEYEYSSDLSSYYVFHTDPSCSQCHIVLGDDTWIFSQRKNRTPEECNTEATEESLFRTEYADFSDYSSYDSLEDLKTFASEKGLNWKMIVLECGFEQEEL